MVSVIQRTTVAPVVDREYLWTDVGRRTALYARVDPDEVVQALYAPEEMRYEQPLGDALVMVMGMADSGRVIMIMCESVERTTRYRILNVRPAAGAELDEWRRRVL